MDFYFRPGVTWTHTSSRGLSVRILPAGCWKRLEAGDYDWSRAARRYWPDRVLARCRTNKSLALAHGRLDVYER